MFGVWYFSCFVFLIYIAVLVFTFMFGVWCFRVFGVWCFVFDVVSFVFGE